MLIQIDDALFKENILAHVREIFGVRVKNKD